MEWYTDEQSEILTQHLAMGWERTSNCYGSRTITIVTDHLVALIHSDGSLTHAMRTI